jgi:hypothetical protein
MTNPTLQESVQKLRRDVGDETEERPSGAKQAAEKGSTWSKEPEEHTSGAKAPVDLVAFTARLKPCPFKTAAQSEFFRSL